MSDVFIRNPYNYPGEFVSRATGLDCSGDPVLTKQEMRDECDINVIVARFGLTGRMPQSVRLPSYGDFTGVLDFRSALEAVRSAESSFMELPAKVRERFANDPQRFLEFCQDPANTDEARRLGLLADEGGGLPPKPIVQPEPVKAAS